jgi:glycerate kinase
MMKILIAPDSYKESLSAQQVAQAIEAGFRDVWPDADYDCLPMADGGEGTVAALIAATGGRRIELEVSGPLGEPVHAFFGLLGDGRTAVIEMAAASGLELVPAARRNPMQTSSRGTGQLIHAALELGARHIILGIGGSATNDAGCGLAQALGARLLNGDGEPLGEPPIARLDQLAHIDLAGMDPRVAECVFDVACDVDNPLLGPRGASAVFGPQKGADAAMIVELDARLARFAHCVESDLGLQVADLPGAGAAGGLGAGAVAMLGATLRPGIDIVSEVVDLEAHVRAADLVITGEGRVDGQSVHGKTPVGVARLAKRHGKPVIALAGCLGDDYQHVLSDSIDAVFSTAHRGWTLEQMLERASDSVRDASKQIATCLAIGQRLP